MTRTLVDENGWFRALPLLLLPGCLVSFNDYPLGDVEGVGGSGAVAGTTSSGARGGREGVLPAAGTQSTAGSEAGEDGGAASSPPGPGENVIDDFQDASPAILEHQGRKGAWYVVNDGMGTQTPRVDQPLVPSLLDPARGTSTRGAHTFGGPFPTWGALVGTTLGTAGDEGQEYDLRGHQGLRLWVRSGSASQYSAKMVRLNLPSPGTNVGGNCTVCNDHFGVDVPLTSEWTQVVVPFSSVKQIGYGRPALAGPELARVTSLQFYFKSNVVFDLWLDDIELY